MTSAPMGAARERALGEARDEYRRLLYVAMTRAADRLVVVRRRAARTSAPEGCWYELVERRAESATRTENRPTTARARCCAIARSPDAGA